MGKSSLLALAVLLTGCTGAQRLQVGPDREFPTPCSAIAVAAPGAVIEIDPVLYSGDVCAINTSGLTLRGVNGRAHLDAAGQNAQGKGIWVVNADNIVIENVEFSGAAVPDNNGAGIRAGGTDITVRNCYFHDNQEGILGGRGNVVIEYSEFDHNGYPDGQAHNVYISHADSLIFRYNYSHNAIIGHLLKSRAAVNYILYNRLTGESGTASYELDIPNGGTTYVIGNIIQQGLHTDNYNLLAYMEEGANALNPGMDLYVVNNTFVNQLNMGKFIAVGKAATLPAIIKNNIFSGQGILSSQSFAVLANNVTADPLFTDPANLDFRLKAGSPALKAGAHPGEATLAFPLAPSMQYAHPACAEQRMESAAIDAGAYSSGQAGPRLYCR